MKALDAVQASFDRQHHENSNDKSTALTAEELEAERDRVRIVESNPYSD